MNTNGTINGNDIAYRALVAASNAAHRNAELAAQGVREIEAQIAQLSVYLERAKDVERLARNDAQAIDAALEKIDAADGHENVARAGSRSKLPRRAASQ